MSDEDWMDGVARSGAAVAASLSDLDSDNMVGCCAKAQHKVVLRASLPRTVV